MKQIDKNTKCYKCFGCNRLEDENFKGVYRCEYATLEQIRINEEGDKNEQIQK